MPALEQDRCYCGSSRSEDRRCHHCDYPMQHIPGTRCLYCERIAARVFL